MSAPGILPVLAAWAGLAAAFAALWGIAEKRRAASLVDAAWAAGIGLTALGYALTLDALPARRWRVAALTGVWSLRLTLYLLRNRVIGKPEDGRYRTLREQWGARATANFFWFFQFQALTVVILSLAPLLAMLNRQPVRALDLAAVLLTLLAVGGETLADIQLARFRAAPANRGKTCRTGLWRYSRHPNYFFEWLHWWIYVLLAIGSPGFWPALAAPAMMLYVLLKVTGLPATEKQAAASRDDYREYQRTTSAFVPWFPKRGAL